MNTGNIHSFIKYLEYRWNARGRHGIHSPFVYSFVEDVVQNRKNIPAPNKTFPGITPHYCRLLHRIIAYYQYNSIQLLPAEQSDITNCDMLIFPEKDVLLWQSWGLAYLGQLKNNTCVALTGIHKSATHTHEWDLICAHKQVLMSIDLYGAGLLFFKDGFKEKQHFVIKY